MRSFYFIANGVVLTWDNGISTAVYFNQSSGKVYYRYKINTLTNIKHPGIYLGRDIRGNEYWVHNHYLVGGANVTTGPDFRQNQKIFVYQEYCTNSPRQVIQSALNQVKARESYQPITYNCQTFANKACHNQRKSESVENALAGVAFVGLLFAVAGLLSSK